MKKKLLSALLAIPALYGAGATLYERRKSNDKIIRSLPQAKNTLFLTFDDGPNPIYTPQLLDLLQQYQAKATFFVVGSLAKKHPKLLQRMADEGHSIGIHHYTHTSSWQLSPRRLAEHIEKTRQVIFEATGKRTHLYRPPWGHFNAATTKIARLEKIILWSHIYGDWKVKKNHLEALRSAPLPEDGAILLLHDNGDTKGADSEAPAVMLNYVTRLLQRGQAQGKQFCALDEHKLP